MIPCTAISVIVTIFFVKRVTLKREDDTAKKAEAKAWVEEKKAKRRGKKGGPHATAGDDHEDSMPSGSDGEQTLAHDHGQDTPEFEKELGDAARGVAEGGGAQPPSEGVKVA